MKIDTFHVLLLAGLAGGTIGCGPQGSPTQAPPQAESRTAITPPSPAAPAPPTFSDYPVAARPAATPVLLARGKEVYEQNCAACHGQHGDGQGVCSAFLMPRPRDFTQGHFRLRSTPSGSLPTDADLFRTVSLGLVGTPMPPWRFLLSETDRWAVVEYIKSFSPRFAEPHEDRTSVVDVGQPPVQNAAGVATGKALYAKMGCANCHGAQGQGDGPSSFSLTDDAGQHIPARDFSKPSGFKAGYAAKEIVRGFLTGFDGTPMPSFNAVMSKEEAWDLAYYVMTLVKVPVTPVARPSQGFTHQAPLGPPEVRVKLTERAWQYDPKEIQVRQGQIVEVTFEPTDNGLGAGHGFAVSGYDETVFINGAMVGVPKSVKFRADHAGRFTYYCATQCSTDKLHPLMNGTLYVEEATPRTASLH